MKLGAQVTTRQLKTGAQGHRRINPETSSTHSPKYSFNLYSLNRRNKLSVAGVLHGSGCRADDRQGNEGGPA